MSVYEIYEPTQEVKDIMARYYKPRYWPTCPAISAQCQTDLIMHYQPSMDKEDFKRSLRTLRQLEKIITDTKEQKRNVRGVE